MYEEYECDDKLIAPPYLMSNGKYRILNPQEFKDFGRFIKKLNDGENIVAIVEHNKRMIMLLYWGNGRYISTERFWLPELENMKAFVKIPSIKKKIQQIKDKNLIGDI